MLTDTQQALLEIQRIETRLIGLKKSLRTQPDRRHRSVVAHDLMTARIAVNSATTQEARK